MSHASANEARLEELLAEQTERALTYNETAELRQLLRDAPDWSEDDFELAAAAAFLALASATSDRGVSPLPGGLRERVSAKAKEIVAELADGDEAVARAPLERGDTIPRIDMTDTEDGFQLEEASKTLESAQPVEVARALAAKLAAADLADGLEPTKVRQPAEHAKTRETPRPEVTRRLETPLPWDKPVALDVDLTPVEGAPKSRRPSVPKDLDETLVRPGTPAKTASPRATIDEIPEALDSTLVSPTAAPEPAPSAWNRGPDTAHDTVLPEDSSQPPLVVPAGADVTKISPAPQPRDNVLRFPRARVVIATLALAASIAAVTAGAIIYASKSTNPVFSKPSLAEQRAQFLKAAPDAAPITWSAATDPLGKPVAGDVAWSNSRQEGFMRFLGLAKNDLKELQYQLWIFDAERDERYPVDGGVFDIDSETGEVIVRIQPKIKVTKATLFAVTAERPGGVVVSTRERLVVVAKVL